MVGRSIETARHTSGVSRAPIEPELGWLPESQRLWATRHRAVLEAIFEAFQRDGVWPDPVELERQLRSGGTKIGVTAAANEMPRSLGERVHYPSSVDLSLFGLGCVPAATELLDAYVATLRLALARFDDVTAPRRLTRRETQDALGLEDHEMDLLSMIVVERGNLFFNGGNPSPGSWDMEIDERVVLYEDITTRDELLTVLARERLSNPIMSMEPRLRVAVATTPPPPAPRPSAAVDESRAPAAMVPPPPDATAVGPVRHDRGVTLTGRTLANLTEPFDGGGGPSHSTIDRLWAAEDATQYLGEGNKADRVMTGLTTLRDGGRPAQGRPVLPADHDKLHRVAAELAEMLVDRGLVEPDKVREALSPPAPRSGPIPGSAPVASATPSGAVPATMAPIPVAAPASSRAVMVVHGQDDEAARALFDWLRSIGLTPAEWSALVKASASGSPFIGAVLDSAFARAQAVVVLFTPDEQTRLRPGLRRDRWRLQARPNVLLEAGMALASHPDRTVLVVLGDQDLPSDLAGRHYVRITDAASLSDLAQRLETAGCAVDRSGSHWLDVSRFPDRDGLDVSPS
jgi:predicted nucleotide-binding protein